MQIFSGSWSKIDCKTTIKDIVLRKVEKEDVGWMPLPFSLLS